MPPFFMLEDLYIFIYEPDWQHYIKHEPWLELLRSLRSFTTVKNFYLSEEAVPYIAPVLQELVWGGTTDVFPTLQNIFLEGLQSRGPVQEGIKQFVAARQVTSHPIAVAGWKRKSWEGC